MTVQWDATQRAYLHALGVSYFVPRFILPGAAPSVRAHIPAQVERAPERPSPEPATSPATAPVETVSREAPATLSAPRLVRPEMPSFDAPDSKAVNPRPENTAISAATDGSDSKPVAFNAALVDTGIGLLLVSDAPKQGLSPEAKRLMANIARAVASHFNLQAALAFSASEFSWPVATLPGLSRLPNVKLDANAASEAFTASLLARSDKQAVHTLLLFGEALAPYLNANMLSGRVHIVHAAAVDQLMQTADAKATLWKQLRALIFSDKSSEE